MFRGDRDARAGSQAVYVGDPWVLAVIATRGRQGPAVSRRALVLGWSDSGGADGEVLRSQVPEVVQAFWAELQRGEFISDAAVAGRHLSQAGLAWVIGHGGVRPRRGRDLKGRCLSFAEREQIAMSHAAGVSVRAIAAQLGRSPSTISRELRRNAEPGGGYRASSAHAMAYHRASRPKPAKLAVNLALRGRSSRICRRGTHRSRSPAGCAWSSPTTRRCGCHRDHLPVDLRAVARRVAPRAGGVSAHRAGAAATEPQGRAAQEPHPEHDQHRRAAGRGRGPRGARELGGGLDHRQAEPDRDRHPGRTANRLRDAARTCPMATSPSRSATRWPRRSRRCPSRCVCR